LVEIAWDIAPDVAHPYADEGQLELALMNLAINARDAMPEGGTIRISAGNAIAGRKDERGLAPGRYVVLAVEDTGCGISADLLERVMEPFFTTKEVGKGTGLGLSMVYGFANQSGGAMRIESREDEGTRVELWLPQAPRSIAAPGTGEPAMVHGPSEPLNILLVDDHDGVRETTAALLADLGHSIVMAADGMTILESLRADPGVNLIISDYAMPHLSGCEVIRRARKIKPGLRAIIITGYADDDGLDLSKEDVVTLNKPFSPNQLRDAIGTAMAMRVPA
jgi:CheY-like chemotaxis protein